MKEKSGRWMTRGVVAFALASLFSDVGHEMATAVLPMFVGSLGLGAAALGAIEGVSDLLSGLAKLGGGAAGQVLRRKKPWTAAGYVATAVGTAGLGYVATLPGLLLLRGTAWIARGFRGPLRDFLVADAVEPSQYGRAYGLERAGDMVGAVLGPLVTLTLLTAGVTFRSVLLFSIIPGTLAALCVVVLVKEKPFHPSPKAGAPDGHGALPAGFRPAIVAITLFGLGDFSRSLLILAASRAAGVDARSGLGPAVLGIPVMLYMLHNGVSAITTIPAGRAADRLGKGGVLAAGYAIGVACNVVLAAFHASLGAVALAFILSGIYIGVEETVEKAMIAEMLPRQTRSWGLGILATANALGDMVSSLYVGFLWDRIGGGAAFGCAAAFSALGTAALLVVRRRARA